MGFGAIIASGEKNDLLGDDLVDCITEVRVEQSLSSPTLFAIRFQEDITGGNPRIRGSSELRCGQMITIAVKDGDEIRCLVRGPITRREWSAMLGGPGSWFEIHGQDRRIEMDRKHRRESWVGLESEIALRILKDEYKFRRTCIQETVKRYGTTRQNKEQEPTTETLNQRATDEAFMRQIACRNNFFFWIEYECRANGLGGGLKVEEIANLRSSPLRTDAVLDCGGQARPRTRTIPTLRVNVEKERCQNVTRVSLKEDSEKPSQFEGTAVDIRSATVKRIKAADKQQPQAKGGERLATCNPGRDLFITTAGGEEELQRKADSALTDAGWFIKAEISTTAHLLGGVLLPHDEVEVEGLGSADDGKYQVKAVTHVINAADHFMDIQLRRNATGGD
ncbi:MAG TPA: hypothetical protein VNO14_05140 [Blastocatellia bacterium]|nr:hypothetical protein [Blastocatellia bacterium]